MYLHTYIIAAYFMHLHTNILIFQYYKVGHFIYYQPKIIKYPPQRTFPPPLHIVSNQKEQRRKNSLFFGNLKVTTLLRNNVRIAANGTVDHADGKWRGRRPFGMANAL